MKNLEKTSLLSLSIATALGLSGCNIELSLDEQGKISSKGIDTLKSSTGVISKEGNKIVVNGVTYDTSDAVVISDGDYSNESQLKDGMLVTVSGTATPDGFGNASLIQHENEVEGSVFDENIASNGVGSLNVVGQTVHVDNSTVFESYDDSDSGVESIDAGDVVEVSGHSSAEGEIWATRVEVKNSEYNSGDELELKGNISNLNGMTFSIGNQQINAENAVLDHEFMSKLQNQQFVEVSSYQGFDSNGVLLADKIELLGSGYKEVRYTNDDQEVEIRGVITDILDTNEIEVDGALVTLANNIPNIQNLLSTGNLVEVEGYVDQNGNFIATEIEVESYKYMSSDNDRDDDKYRDGDDDSNDDNYRDSVDDSNDDNYRDSDDDSNDDNYRDNVDDSDDDSNDNNYRDSDDDSNGDNYRDSDDDDEDEDDRD